jgi:hypothetical protein
MMWMGFIHSVEGLNITKKLSIHQKENFSCFTAFKALFFSYIQTWTET